jgi:phosphatidate phosphatase APP1
MLRQTLTGSALTRTPFAGAPELYRDLAAGTNPFFYVSSSPWNLHSFLVAFLHHRDFPLGPVLLRDLLGNGGGREPKHGRIREVLDLYPELRFVLIGDSGEQDPQIYADIVREYPDRVLAVYIREVRLDPGDGRVEQVTDAWDGDVPFVLAADSDAVRRHSQSLGLLRAPS